MLRLSFTIAAALLSAACSRAPSPEVASSAAADVGSFVVRLGKDTIAIENFARSGNRLEGEILQRVPATRLFRYAVALNDAGQPDRVEYQPLNADGTVPARGLQAITLTFAADSITRIARFADSTSTRRYANPGLVTPFLFNSIALYELGVRTMRAASRDTVGLRYWNISSATIANPTAMRLWPDSVRFDYFGAPLMFRTDRSGRIMSVDGSRTTMKIAAARQSAVDLAALARASAARDQAGAALGAPSPRDTARATVGGTTLLVDYGRPARRGRAIWVNGVLGDTLWRTGANAATQLRVDRDITLGGAPVPAGTYTLWTHAKRDGTYDLIINRQTGQWGTEYRADRDLARVPLTKRTLPEIVERFRIVVEPAANGGFLRLAWDTTELSVPFTTHQ